PGRLLVGSVADQLAAGTQDTEAFPCCLGSDAAGRDDLVDARVDQRKHLDRADQVEDIRRRAGATETLQRVDGLVDYEQVALRSDALRELRDRVARCGRDGGSSGALVQS